ncbi:serine hydrolase-like protein [Cheilinus undulatus]|uniref:serine hydrolase-like protein n=1 Tax=Cheilinus undulatus TaxID=241271 RepID=UPI001BD4D336|nr:serine hydrolase-like protein [Cheilinus undulatus]XP_041641592.1 serine hydrolase-like protein [Cheilinus undulatus]
MSTTLKEVSEISIPLPWGQIKARAWGPDDGYPVLCLHGWADNCGSFNTLIPLLPKECRYVALDHAGHGLSSHRPSGVFYTFPSYVADLYRVADGLKWTKFSIIGHSMGGNVAGMFSALYPEMVDAIILLDAPGFLPKDAAEISELMREGIHEMLQYETKAEQKTKVYTYEKAMERLLAANPTLSEESVRILLERGLAAVEGGFVFSRDLRLNFKNIVRLTLEQSLEMQSRIKSSVLVVLADKGLSTLQDSKQKETISTLLQGYLDRNHTVVTVPGDHHVHLNNPEVVAPVVSDFLQRKVISQQLSAS